MTRNCYAKLVSLIVICYCCRKSDVCIEKARLLTRAINDKSPLITGVTKLSILKIAQLEHVQFYLPRNSSSRAGKNHPHFEQMHLHHRYSYSISMASTHFLFCCFQILTLFAMTLYCIWIRLCTAHLF